MNRVFKMLMPSVAALLLHDAMAHAQSIAPQPGQAAFRARPHAAHVRACERAIVQKVSGDKNGAVTQLIDDSVEEWQITNAKHGVRGDGRYLASNHWKHFRFSCLYGSGSGVSQLEYHNVADISSPATIPAHPPRANQQAFKACEAAVRAKIIQEKNTGDVNLAADGADEWDVGPGVIGVRGHGFYQHNSFRFHCNYDTRHNRVTAIDYHKTYDGAVVPQPAPSPAPAAQQQMAQQGSASERAGRGQFKATGNIPCAVSTGQPMMQCPFGVARDPGGSATVVVTWPDGRKRAIFFERGKAIGADVAQSEGNRPFSARSEGDLHFIRIGPERYEIPEAVIFGG